ncbi:MAG: ribosome silencing factor [Chloroflexi bacterium]|nr:ribosome silencing factor [Chloroflexota bacterium]
MLLNALELSHTIIESLDDKLAENIILLDISKAGSSIADYFVIASASSNRQSQALVETLLTDLRPQKIRPMHVEGEKDSGWQLIDFGNVIVHIFSPEQRAFYRLEDLWHQAQVVVRLQ